MHEQRRSGVDELQLQKCVSRDCAFDLQRLGSNVTMVCTAQRSAAALGSQVTTMVYITQQAPALACDFSIQWMLNCYQMIRRSGLYEDPCVAEHEQVL
ncbi:hypothetical protein C0Q70_02962 [Pomacea canaliculata]|uniref:Uncharacterized protein n=1 Tax=Pomacea canaliculata TaxID=400727 RepID=A0A2T7PRD9_POMCA|nr:hypothetical protein C0Q70_02962 [Pomacea canaliculata]